MKRFVTGFLIAALLALAPVANAQSILSRFGVFNPTNPTGTTSLTGVMMGLGTTCLATSQKTGNWLIVFQFEAVNSTAADGARAKLQFGTGTPPANAAAPAGTAVGVFQGSTNGATVVEQMSVVALVTGLQIGVLTWFDLNLEAVTGGTATISQVSCEGVELAGG